MLTSKTCDYKKEQRERPSKPKIETSHRGRLLSICLSVFILVACSTAVKERSDSAQVGGSIAEKTGGDLPASLGSTQLGVRYIDVEVDNPLSRGPGNSVCGKWSTSAKGACDRTEPTIC